jgi:hypothetical protein
MLTYAAGKLLAALCADPNNSLTIWDWSNGCLLARSSGHSGGLRAVLSVRFLSEAVVEGRSNSYSTTQVLTDADGC